MKILVIMGSPRKGNTYHAAEQIREEMQSRGPVEFEYLWLSEWNIVPCRGCLTCFVKGEAHCPIKDRVPEIEQKMLASDGVIFATPVYGMNVSGQFKTFVDRLAYIFHRPRFFDKKALLLTTTGALGIKNVLDYLNLVVQVWGFEVSARAGIIIPPMKIPAYRAQENTRVLARAAGQFYSALVSGTRRSPGISDVIVFHGQRGWFGELEHEFPVDYQYWKERGWLDPGTRYFVDVPVNPLYTAIGWIVNRIAKRQSRKDLGDS
jgi:multimeric flavodoxin WrbA